MIKIDQRIGKQLDAEGNSDGTPLYDRIHGYYPTVDLFIHDADFREEPKSILIHGYKGNLDVTYITLPKELLAYSMTCHYDKKPEYIKEANRKFYNKYINYIADKSPNEIFNFDKEIINNLNVLMDKKILENNVQTIQPKKLVLASI